MAVLRCCTPQCGPFEYLRRLSEQVSGMGSDMSGIIIEEVCNQSGCGFACQQSQQSCTTWTTTLIVLGGTRTWPFGFHYSFLVDELVASCYSCTAEAILAPTAELCKAYKHSCRGPVADDDGDHGRSGFYVASKPLLRRYDAGCAVIEGACELGVLV